MKWTAINSQFRHKSDDHFDTDRLPDRRGSAISSGQFRCRLDFQISGKGIDDTRRYAPLRKLTNVDALRRADEAIHEDARRRGPGIPAGEL
jgi:hypothetical protein